MKDHSVSIVLPVYNQEDHIAVVVSEYREVLINSALRFEILLVTNGCKDGSAKVCDALEKEFQEIRHVPSASAGWGAAVRFGILNAKHEVICYTNSARTTAEDLLLIVLYAVANPGALIKANRKIRESWFRRLGSLSFNILCRALFDFSFWDVNGTPKAFPRTLKGLFGLHRNDDLIDLEVLIACKQHSYRVLEVPILSCRRHGGKSTTNLKSAFRLYTRAIRMRITASAS